MMTTMTTMTTEQDVAPMAGDDARPVARKWLWFWAGAVTLMYALLWSPQWYPLSDSSLYLSLGRSVALGRGLTVMGDPVRLVPPLTPLFIGMLIKMGAGIGVIQAAMIVLMLVSHALCFLTLRRWTNERLALAATLASALSYWVFANAFTIMSEPLCVALMWGGFLALSHVTLESPRRWVLLIAACVLLVLAAANRDAIFCLLPGPLLAVLIRARRGGRWSRESMAWAALFVVVFGSWFLYRYPPKFLVGMLTPRNKLVTTTQSTTAPTANQPALAINPEFEAEPEATVREGRYQAKWMNGVKRDFKHMLTEPPVLGGRWVCEGMVMASVGVFDSKVEGLKVFGTTAALIAFVLAIAGGIILLRRGHWWVVGPAMYFAFIWLQWGTRIKPRYMVPIAPVLFLFVWSGLTWLIVLLAAQPKGSRWNGRRVGQVVLAVLVGIVLLGNAFPWGVEFYVRHVAGREFYGVARRGAYAQLVDIGAYAQQHVPPGQTIWMNAGAHRRIAYFLSGRRIETSELALGDWKDWNRLLQEYRDANPTTGPTTRATTTGPTTGALATTRPATTQATSQPLVAKRRMSAAMRRRLFFNGIARQGRYLIVFVNHPRGGKTEGWPGWHLPMRDDDTQVEWWRLYERQADDTWKVVSVPRSREYVRGVPPAD
ncbi:MAG: hypothetical protein JWN40_718 [Phycisphaerales bacterium]|nr:hypothetical protein [Phycisphaerales bacterium]